jgi:hypothetical protein
LACPAPPAHCGASPCHRLPKPLGVLSYLERNLRTAPCVQRPRSLAVYGPDPLHDLSSSSYNRCEPPPIPRSILSIFTRRPRHRSRYNGHLQSRPTACRIVVRRGDRNEWNSTLLFLAQTSQSSSAQILTRSLSDIDRSTAANDPRPSASCSARKSPRCIPASTPPFFPGLRPRIWPHLLRLVTNGNVEQAPSPQYS